MKAIVRTGDPIFKPIISGPDARLVKADKRNSRNINR